MERLPIGNIFFFKKELISSAFLSADKVENPLIFEQRTFY